MVTDNPAGVVYKATFPDKPFFTTGTLKGNVKGSITALAAANGTGVQFSVDFQNLPTEGGPFCKPPFAQDVSSTDTANFISSVSHP